MMPVQQVTREILKHWLPIYIALSLAWGISYLWVAVSLEIFSPVQVNFLRSLFGTLTLLPFILARKLKISLDKVFLIKMIILALLANVIPGILIAKAQSEVSSSLVAMFTASTPIFISLIIFFIIKDEVLNTHKVFSIFFGFLGTILLVSSSHELNSGSLGNLIALTLAVLSMASSYYFTKVYIFQLNESFIMITFIQLLFSSLIQYPFVELERITFTEVPIHNLLAVSALGAISTGFAYVWNFQLIERIGGIRASMVSYLVPFLASLLGVLILKESIGVFELLGGILIIFGVSIGNFNLPGTQKDFVENESK